MTHVSVNDQLIGCWKVNKDRLKVRNDILRELHLNGMIENLIEWIHEREERNWRLSIDSSSDELCC